VIYMANSLLQIGYRIEHGRGLSGDGYISRHHEILERGFRTWLAEQKLLSVHVEIFDPESDLAYEVGKVLLEYSTNPREEAVKPPIEQLEEILARLESLPPGAKLRVVAMRAAGASIVPGWQPATLKALIGGVSEELDVGDGPHGFGHIVGKIRYVIGKWGKPKEEEPHTIILQ
jgi:hypothetical protein